MRSSGDPLVTFRGLARTYGRGRDAVVAVHGATGALHAGQHVALRGPSGSGKTTLLHLLAGIDRPTAGTIAWPAIVPRAPLPPHELGVVFQGPSLLPALDVVENVSLPLLLAGAGHTDAERRARDALDALGLAELAPKLPGELSGGQSQRVALARALAPRPRLLVADEPTGQLDRATATFVVEALLRSAAESGAALVLSTHDAAVADRLPEQWSMHDGRLLVGTGQPCWH